MDSCNSKRGRVFNFYDSDSSGEVAECIDGDRVVAMLSCKLDGPRRLCSSGCRPGVTTGDRRGAPFSLVISPRS